jgi:CRP-like cAMP-binding protein
MKRADIFNEGRDRFRVLVDEQDFRRLVVNKGDFITRQHQAITEVYWAREAQFSILHTAENGKTLSLGDYSLEDNFFGEVEFFSGNLCSFDAVATTTFELVVIPQDKMTEILIADSKITFWMNHRMSDIYQRSMVTAIDRSLFPLKFNVIKDIVNRYTSQALPTSHSYMYQEAQRFGCTERAYTRVIHELIDEGLVRKGGDGSSIEPVDIDKLSAYLAKYHK